MLMPTLEFTTTPGHLVTSAFMALKSKDYRALARLCDPISLRSFKAEIVEEFCGECYDDGAEETDSVIPTLELTDEQYVEWGQYLDPLRRLKVEFPDVSTIEELSAMEPVDVFASWLEGQSYDRFLENHSSREPWEGDDSSWRPDSLQRRRDSGADYHIIGCVYDAPDIAHVLYRSRLSAAEVSDAYYDWLANAPSPHREFMTAMHHRGEPIMVTCRRQPDQSWLLVAKRHFMLFGSLEIIELHSDE
jgi:hypothetical protein